MEHRRNSTGLIFRRFAIFYGIFWAILPIFDAYFVRQPACPTFLAIIPSKLCATCSARFYRSIAFSFLSCWPAAMFSIAASRSTIPDLNDFRQFSLYQRQKQCLSQGHIPSNHFVAIFSHRPTASFASQICCFFAWFCSFHSPVAHKTTKANQKEYRFPDYSVAKFVILYYI